MGGRFVNLLTTMNTVVFTNAPQNPVSKSLPSVEVSPFKGFSSPPLRKMLAKGVKRKTTRMPLAIPQIAPACVPRLTKSASIASGKSWQEKAIATNMS